METKDFLTFQSAAQLASRCQRIASNKLIDLATAARAKELKQEWMNLQKPSGSDYKAAQRMLEKRDALKSKMVEFLAEM